MTDAEKILWQQLRSNRLDNQKFRRQQPIGPYIVDFVHFDARFIVEADGGQHNQSTYDQHRDAWLKAQGFFILRFWNDDILLHTESVLEKIWQTLKMLRRSPLTPAPLPLRKRGVVASREVRGAENISPARAVVAPLPSAGEGLG